MLDPITGTLPWFALEYIEGKVAWVYLLARLRFAWAGRFACAFFAVARGGAALFFVALVEPARPAATSASRRSGRFPIRCVAGPLGPAC